MCSNWCINIGLSIYSKLSVIVHAWLVIRAKNEAKTKNPKLFEGMFFINGILWRLPEVQICATISILARTKQTVKYHSILSPPQLFEVQNFRFAFKTEEKLNVVTECPINTIQNQRKSQRTGKRNSSFESPEFSQFSDRRAWNQTQRLKNYRPPQRYFKFLKFTSKNATARIPQNRRNKS